MIRYYSTNQQAPEVTFQKALFQGLAPDGGLYFPTKFPTFSAAELAALHGASLPEVGYRVLQKWFGEEIEAESLRHIAMAAQYFPIPLRQVGSYQILELFHGPTQAFKDVAAQNLSRLMSHFLQQQQQRVTLLVATSGDTGGAIAHGFSGIDNINVVILYPKAPIQSHKSILFTKRANISSQSSFLVPAICVFPEKS